MSHVLRGVAIFSLLGLGLGKGLRLGLGNLVPRIFLYPGYKVESTDVSFQNLEGNLALRSANVSFLSFCVRITTSASRLVTERKYEKLLYTQGLN
jgi:hypothetical protein